VAEALDDLAARTATAIDAMGEALARVDRDKAPRGAVQSLTGRVAELQHDLDRTQGGVEWRTTEELVARVAESASEAAARLSARLGELDERKAERADLRQVAARIDIRSPDPGFDEFYASYEDHFRGTRRDIKQRVAIYLPIVGRAQAGTPSAPVLDVGCGRGEWLELLRETGLAGRGVDSNPAMVSSDRQRGLDVVLGDGIAYLRGLDEGSLGAVTAMHLIEHLRFDDQVRLLDAALRALRPGGVAIFETPNPENLNVGAHTFWNDPTHVHPVPPEPLRVMAELRGFTRTEILRLHPYPTSAHLAGSAEPMRDHINHVLFGPQDYALVAFKS
jgi:SAM-dependent methyltransferase